MTEEQIKILASTLGVGRIMFDEPLKDHTYFKQKGKAGVYFEAKTSTDLEAAVRVAILNNIPYCVLGFGSNTFLSSVDKFFIIKNTSHSISVNGFRTSITSRQSRPEVLIKVDSGSPLSMLARYCIHEGISGLEFLLGIPGTVGPGLRNNVGVPPTIKNLLGYHLQMAEIIDHKTGQKKLVSQAFFEFEYGKSFLQTSNDILLTAVFKLEKTPSKDPWEKASDFEIKGVEIATGPVFKNIEYIDAVRLATKHLTLSPSSLIQEIAVEGLEIGGVRVSNTNHNSFILNSDFEVEDVARMIRLIKRKIRSKFKINLVTQLDMMKLSSK